MRSNPSPAHGLGQAIQQAHGVFPANACVGDALAVF
jgi:hypothetical protein